MRLLGGVALIAALALVLVTAAQAASLVYIQGANVWIADADGGNPHQVTSDGNASNPDQTAYRSPTEADNGTIVALKGANVVHLDQNGTVIKSFAPDTNEYPLAAAVSPNASTVAYNYSQLTSCTLPPFSCGIQPQPGSDVTPTDGSPSSTGAIQEGEQDGRWIANSALVLQNDSSYIDYEPIGGSAQHWFAPNDIAYNVQPVVSRDEKYLVSVLRPTSTGGNPSTSDVLQIFQVNGFPPASTTAPTLLCQFQAEDAGGFQRPDIAPDDSAIIWYDNGGEERTAIPAGCTGGATFTLSGGGAFIAGATQGSYGVAANAPSQPVPSPPPGSGTFSKASLRLAKSLKRAVLLKRGLKTSLRCNAACGYVVAVGVNNATARKLGLTHKKGAVVVGDRAGRFGGGTRAVTVKLSAKARRAISRSRLSKLSLIVAVAAKGADGEQVEHAYSVTIRR